LNERKNRISNGATALKDFIACDFFPCEPASEGSLCRETELFTVCLATAGVGLCRVFDREIPCKEGDVCVIPPQVDYGFFYAEEGDGLALRRIRFRLCDWFEGEIADKGKWEYCYGIFNDSSPVAYTALNSHMQDRVYSLFDYIECETRERQRGWQRLVGGYLENLFISIGRYEESAIKSVSFTSFKEWNTVSSVVNILKNEYRDPELTLESIARRTYVSKAQLSKSFSKVMGVNFSEYLRDMRLKQVCILLESTDMNIEDIARECGFYSIAAFYKAFGAELGKTPNEYRRELLRKHSADGADEYKKLLNGEKVMSILNEINENIQKGKAKIVKELVQQALDEGVKPADILDQGLLAGMNVVGERFKNSEIYVPEVLVAARAMNMGSQILKPHLVEAGVVATGKVCIGTVRGDLHDIGKNLVKMMMEGKGLEVIDLGTDVAPEVFVSTAIEQGCQVICCSALLTTTMSVMEEVVKAAEAAGIRDKVKIMVGGAPVSEDFCKQIDADCYTVDAASAAEAAVALCKN
jgi:corrinoid protein of di/trimethylamine methyltransferase